jgi:hypothetical protein
MFLLALVAVLSLSTTPALSDEGGSLEPGMLGVGFDEGFLFRLQLAEKISSYIGVGFYVKGPDTTYRQPLNNVSWKLGGEYTVAQFDNLKVNSFLEWREELNQGESQRSAGGNTLRYNQYNTIIRAGIRPEWFFHERISIDYKIGLQFIHHGPDYKLNAAGNDLESRKNDYDEVSSYSGRFAGEKSLLLNLGMTLYLGKLPFFK